MSHVFASVAERSRRPRWLDALYAIPIVSALALATMVAGDIYYAFESADHTHDEADHGVAGQIFDLGWVVFLPTAFATLISGSAALITGPLTRRPRLTRYGLWAIGYVVLAIAVVVAAALLES